MGLFITPTILSSPSSVSVLFLRLDGCEDLVLKLFLVVTATHNDFDRNNLTGSSTCSSIDII